MMVNMNVMSPSRQAPPLHDLLGVSFVFNRPITALAWDRDFACFGLKDGAAAILRAHWDGAPGLGLRSGGGVQLIAATAPPPPPAIFVAHRQEVLALAGDPVGGLISGGADGLIQRLINGDVQTIETRARRHIFAVAAGRGGRRAFATGRQVDRVGPDARRLILPAPVTCLAYDPSGLQLAVGYQGGISLEACAIRHEPRRELCGTHTILAWNRDGSAIAAASPAGGVALRHRAATAWTQVDGLRGAPRSIAFTADGALIIGGEEFVEYVLPGETAQELGGSLSAPVACHPHLGIIACADPAGRIFLRRIGMDEALCIREPGAVPLFLAFAPDGQALTFAAADGEAGTVILSDLLFRTGAQP
jgi:hypothetical protein